MPRGLRLVDGFPWRAGLRAGDVVVDCRDGLLFFFDPTAPRNAHQRIGFNVEQGLSHNVQKRRGALDRNRIHGGGIIDVVDDASLVEGARVVEGEFVVGPRAVEVHVDMHQRHRIVTRWDVVGRDEVLEVAQVDDGFAHARRLPWHPAGIVWGAWQPRFVHGDDGYDDDRWLPNPRWGVMRPEIVKRFLVDAGAQVWSSSAGWDGRIHVADVADEMLRNSEDPAATWTSMVHFAKRNGGDRDLVVDVDGYAACATASDDEVVGVVAGLRPELVRVEQQYREELAILAARPR